ncbi:hypothetical protein [Alicyclobacillus sp. SP_1]|uniref:hypothetical protein n=1 Tax=Alicyclobacillus sp. SP_1 TaxID=2942475 RepID=UPI002158302F|nr:hypothetical protein [Alicyclobacillus sp. SP_1]
MAGNATTSPLPNVSNTLGKLGFHPINPMTFLDQITQSFGTLIQTVFSWIYFLSEIAVLVGALVFVVGAIGHNSRIKRTGAHIVLYAILGFIASIVLPGVLVAINDHLKG